MTAAMRYVQASDGPDYDIPVPPDDAPPSRHLSYITGEWSVELDYAGLTALMDEIFDLWDSVEAEGTTEVIGNHFEALIERVAHLREYTGWDGIPAEYLTSGSGT